MKLKTPVSKAILRHHFAYNFWKYVLVGVLSVFIVDLIYTTTAYRVPDDKRIDVYIQGALTEQNHIDQIFEQMRINSLPGVEVIRSALLFSDAQNDMYAAQQLTTYLAVGEGDLYILRSEDFKHYASQGVFVDLTQSIKSGQLHVQGIDLSAGYVATQENETDKNSPFIIGEKRLFGIPAASLEGLQSEFGIANQNSFIAMTIFNGNDEQVLSFLNSLIARTYIGKEESLKNTESMQP